MTAIRIETAGLRWGVPAREQIQRTTVSGVPALVVPAIEACRRSEPDGRTVGRAAVTAPSLDLAWLEGFTLEHGPLVAPRRGYLYLDECAQAIETLRNVGERWAAPVEQIAFLTVRDFPEGTSTEGLRQSEPEGEYARRREWVQPLFNQYARAHVRLEIEGAELVIRPADLLGLLWLTAARKIVYAVNTSRCRSLKCGQPVEHIAGNGKSMTRQYCSTNCKQNVHNNPQDDRWPELRGLSRPEQNALFLQILRRESPELFKGTNA